MKGIILKDDVYKIFLEKLFSSLKDLDLKRSGSVFHGPVSYGDFKIRFQKSVKSSLACVVFTADVLLVHQAISKMLADKGYTGFCDFQYSRRIGFFRDTEDYWWQISNLTEVSAVTGEVACVIRERVLPGISHIRNEQGLIAMWESGESPGLSADQRITSLAMYYYLTGNRESLEELLPIAEQATRPRPGGSLAVRAIRDLL